MTARSVRRYERFVLPEGASFYALFDRRHEPGNGERIDKALHAIEDANIGKLRDVFQDISFNSNKLGEERQKNDLLRHLLEDFAKPELNMRLDAPRPECEALQFDRHPVHVP